MFNGKSTCTGAQATPGIGVKDTKHAYGSTGGGKSLRAIIVCVLCALVVGVFKLAITRRSIQPFFLKIKNRAYAACPA